MTFNYEHLDVTSFLQVFLQTKHLEIPGHKKASNSGVWFLALLFVDPPSEPSSELHMNWQLTPMRQTVRPTSAGWFGGLGWNTS